jgi:hypothetical protein
MVQIGINYNIKLLNNYLIDTLRMSNREWLKFLRVRVPDSLCINSGGTPRSFSGVYRQVSREGKFVLNNDQIHSTQRLSPYKTEPNLPSIKF